ncbi:MAG: hypothetical protein KGJ82_17270 [Nitrospirota bacterium]|nr:hypothetical protein [Nitrospirota bacterium]
MHKVRRTAQQPIDLVREPGLMAQLENRPKAIGAGSDRSRHLQNLGWAEKMEAF